LSLVFSGLIARPALRHPLRTAVSIAGVAIGVGAIAAIHRANRSVTGSFRQAVDAISGRTRLSVEGVDGVAEDAGRRLGWLWDAGGAFAPVIDRFAICADGTDEPVEILGVDVTAEDPVRRYRLRPSASHGDLRSLFEADAVLAPDSFVARHRLSVGDRLALFAHGQRSLVRIAGVLEPIGPARASGGQVLVTGLRHAQRIFGRTGRVDRLDVVFPESLSEAAVAGRIAASLPPGLTVARPSARSDAADRMVRAYRFNLTALGSIALLVGAFLIYNTVSMSVVRRWPEIGTLRALGASKGMIFRGFLAEGLVIGAIGTAAGEILGLALSQAILSTVGETVVDIYRTTARLSLASSAEPLVTAAVVGLAASLAASLAPAWEAAGIAPAATMRTGAIEGRRRGRSLRFAASAVAFAVAGIALAFLPAVGGFPLFGFLAVGCAIGALAAATVPAILFLESAARRPLRRLFGAPGRLAASFFAGNLSRNAVAIAALALALGMAAAMAIMIASLRRTVLTWVDQSASSDLFVKSATGERRGIVGTMPPEAISFLREIPGVAVVDSFRTIEARDSRGNPFTIGAGDYAVAARTGALPLLSGRDPAAVFAAARLRGEAFVSEPYSRRFRVGRGDRITLPTPAGPRRIAVADVYPDYSNDRGTVVIDRPMFLALFHDPDVSTIAVRVAPGVAPETVRDRILAAARGRFALSILTSRTLKKEVMKIFDRTFAVTRALEAIALAVAVLGVVNALFALVLERRRELSLLTILGTSRGQLRGSIALEAALIGVAALLLAAMAAAAFAALLILVINPQSFGWSIRTEIPWANLAAASLLALAATIAASAGPARLAAAADPAAGMREE
jgi:putative ABC transport system permease protein